MTPDLELYAFDGFESWYKEEFGVDLLVSQNKETNLPILPKISVQTPPKMYRTEHLKSGNPNPAQQEVINKLASILVDMVLEENTQKMVKIL
ncbi:MAG: hypothetical protein UZ22_OP11002000526 [Microgenomates bacterium OLB23]|nr:MAG: hypothetical protein UZ22_OP11002000526 [Microgenomates bacterium OLB23]